MVFAFNPMNTVNTNWTKKELKAYILLYCAHADFVDSPEEMKFIQTKVSKADFQKVHNEFESDSDFDRIRKIQSGLALHQYDQHQLDQLLADIQSVFFADGHYTPLEHNLLRALKHLMK